MPVLASDMTSIGLALLGIGVLFGLAVLTALYFIVAEVLKRRNEKRDSRPPPTKF